MTFEHRSIASLIVDGSIISIQDGNHGEQHPKASEYVSHGIPFVMASDIRNNVLDIEKCEKLPKSRTDKLRIGFARSGDVLLTHKRTVGGVCIAPATHDYFMLTPQVTYYRVDSKKLCNRFLAIAFRIQAFHEQLNQVSAQSTRPYVPISTQKNLTIPWHPYSVQLELSKRVSAYDELIENNMRRIAILEEMARRIFEEWFVHFRAPGCEGLPLVDSAIGAVPEGWAVTSLETICRRITDGAHHSPASVPVGKRMASVRDMRTWGFELSDCRFISDADYNLLVRNNCRPEPGDILIAKDGANLNKHTFLVSDEMDVVILSSIAIIRPISAAEAEFLVAMLKSDDVSRRIKNSRTGAAIPRIILKDFRRLPILMPPLDQRLRFDAIVRPLHQLCRRLSQASANLRAQRDLLLPKLISGEIDVSAAPAPLRVAAE